MKKLLSVGAVALTLTLASAQQASAWHNFKFGIGMNIEWSAGNNNCLWGMFRSGDYGGEAPFGRHGGHGFGGHGFGGGFGAPCHSGGFGHHDYAFAPAPYAMPVPTAHAAAPMTYPSYYSPYYTAGYNYYSMPAYYYPATWYGR